MPRSIARCLALGAFVLLLGALSPLAATPLLAQAPGDVPQTQIDRRVVGPYDVTVYSIPRNPVEGLGGPRFSVRVLKEAGAAPLTGATVNVAMQRPDGSEAGQVTLTENPELPGLYERRVTIPEVGRWAWTVAVTGPQGLETLSGTLDVVEGPSAGRAGFIAWIVMLCVLVGLGLLAWRSLRPKQRNGSPAAS